MLSEAIATIVRRIPPRWRSSVLGKYSAAVEQPVWDQEYKAGRWDFLSELSEMPRYAVIAGCLKLMSTKGSRVLDVGCGTGLLLEWLALEMQHQYVGIDISKAAIEQARARHPKHVHFELADAANYEPKSSFTFVIFNEVLYYMDPERVLERYRAFLRPDGFFIISMWEAPESDRSWQRCALRLDVVGEVQIRSGELGWCVRLARPRS